jgi:hypothetical protein
MKRFFRQYHMFRRPTRRGRHRTGTELRQVEVDLLRLQVRVSFANVLATIALSAALLTLTFCQWRTAESTAVIERAKAQPHFRITQENQHDELGFLPRRFQVQADAGVSDATAASATSFLEIYFVSRVLGIAGRCRASFVNFYGWTNDAMSFELNDAADRLMNFSRTPDRFGEAYIRMRPLWVVVGVSFNDIFGTPQRQDLLLLAGTPRPINRANFQFNSRAGVSLHLQVDGSGNIVVFRVDEEPISRDCADALRVMGRIAWLRMARPDELPQDHAEPFVADPQSNTG